MPDVTSSTVYLSPRIDRARNGLLLHQIEPQLPDNPDWDDFKFRFVSSEHMDSAKWTDFMDAEVNLLKSK